MRILFTLVLSVFLAVSSFGQTNTEVYLCNMEFTENGFVFSGVTNISHNPGYNNQPYFITDEMLVYARNHNGQPDIGYFSLKDAQTTFFNTPTEGGEYSPKPIPNSPDLAAVRLDADGKQQLYRYFSEKEGNQVLIPEVAVAYFAFVDENEVLASVLGLNQLDLVRIHLQTKEITPIVSNAGRSIQRIPGTNLLSYSIVNNEKNLDVYQYDPESGESYFVCQLPIGIQDYVWYEDYKIIIGSGTQLFVYDLFGDTEWREIGNLKSYGFNNITRLAISPGHTHLAFAAEPLAK